MRLQKFINEEIPYDEPLFKLIDRRASKFVREMKSWDNFLFRGSYRDIEKWEIRKSHVSEGRPPKGMTMLEQYIINEGFIKKFGWPGRYGVFATSNSGDYGADLFGTAYIFIPLNDYKYIWSPKIKDINIDPKEVSASHPLLKRLENEMEKALDKIGPDAIYNEKTKQKLFSMVEKQVMGIVNTYTDKDLQIAVKHGNEVSFNCDEYLLIYPSYFKPLSKKYL